MAQQNPIPEKFTNLNVLPAIITRQELVPVMRNFALQPRKVTYFTCHRGVVKPLTAAPAGGGAPESR